MTSVVNSLLLYFVASHLIFSLKIWNKKVMGGVPLSEPKQRRSEWGGREEAGKE